MERLLGTLLLLGLVAGCGGGGGGSSITPPPTASVVISSANATTVAGQSAAAVFQTSELGGLVSADGFVTGAPAQGKTAREATFTTKVVPRLASIPFGPETSACDMAGTVTLSGDLASAVTLTAGDRITAQFDVCDDGDGTMTNGTLEFVVDSFSGDLLLGQFSLSVTLTLTNLQVTEGGETTTIDGAASVALDTTQAPVSTVTVSGDSFTVTSGLDSATLSDFSTTMTVDNTAAPGSFVLNSGATLNASAIAGVVTYSTPVDFSGFVGEYPSSGEMLVTGADNSSLRLIALTNTSVRIEITNSDGSMQTIETTWEELDP